MRLNRARLYIANHRAIKLERQAKAVQGLPPNGYRDLTTILDRNESEFAKAVMAEESLLIIFGAGVSAATRSRALVSWGLARGNVRFAYLGDHANSRGAADMGLLPDLLPGYVPVSDPGAFAQEYPGMPATPGMTQPEMFDAARQGSSARCWSSAPIPSRTLGIDPATLKNTFVIVQDMFLTETAALADVVFPAASLYEKTGTVTNTYGDVQLAKKAADKAGVKPDFEILVRLAGSMGVDVQDAGALRQEPASRPISASPAERSPAKRTAMRSGSPRNGLEPKLSPFDPLAVLDEIERLVPAYKLDRLNLSAATT